MPKRDGEPKLYSDSLYEELAFECDAMIRYALGRGRDVTPAIVETVASALGELGTKPPITKLAKAHRKLALIVAPAEPRSLRLLHELAGRDPGRAWFRMSLPRNLTMVAILAIVVVLAVGTSPDISADPDAGNPMVSNGATLLLNQLFFLSIAALGSCFHGLFTVKRYIVAGTFDPSYAPTYWIRFLLGVMSGLILASLVEVDESSSLHAIARPVLALVGGFSAAVVHRALERLVMTVDNLLQGDARRLVAEEKRMLMQEGEQRVRDTKLETAASLLKIQDELRDDPEQARASIRKLMTRLAPDADAVEHGSTPAEGEQETATTSDEAEPDSSTRQ